MRRWRHWRGLVGGQEQGRADKTGGRGSMDGKGGGSATYDGPVERKQIQSRKSRKRTPWNQRKQLCHPTIATTAIIAATAMQMTCCCRPCDYGNPSLPPMNRGQPTRRRTPTDPSNQCQRALQQQIWQGSSAGGIRPLAPQPFESARFILDNVLGAELVEDAAATLIALDRLPRPKGDQLLAGCTREWWEGWKTTKHVRGEEGVGGHKKKAIPAASKP